MPQLSWIASLSQPLLLRHLDQLLVSARFMIALHMFTFVTPSLLFTSLLLPFPSLHLPPFFFILTPPSLPPSANIDFVSTQVTLIFEVGDIRQCLNITVLDDKIEEGNVGETFYVQLVPASGSSDHIIFYINNLYGIVIEDSDSKLGIQWNE